MQRLMVLALAGCAATPGRSAPPTVERAGAIAPTPEGERRPAPLEPLGRRFITRAVRVDGLARFDHVALLEAGLLCGTRAGHAPVCATDPQFMAYAEPYERLQDVAALAALGGTHCALFGAGVLRCDRATPASPVLATPERWAVTARDVVDFAISSPPGALDVVVTLGRDGAVRRFVPGDAAAPPTLLATDARGVASLGAGGACAVLASGEVVCSDPLGTDPALRPTGITDATAVFYGGAALRADGTWAFAAGVNPAYLPLPPAALDYAFQGLCVLEPDGGVTCGGLGPDWREIELPAPARRFAPDGYALCAELVDDTTACWGPFLDGLIRLGARASTTLAR